MPKFSRSNLPEFSCQSSIISVMYIDRTLRSLLIVSCLFIKCKGERDFFSNQQSTPGSIEEFVDPHSFYYDKNTQKEVASSYIRQTDGTDGTEGSDDDQCKLCEKELHLCRISLRNRPSLNDVADELFSRRFVNTLLSRAKLKQDGGHFRGHLELDATESELEALKKFAEGQATIREVDATLNRIMKTPEHEIIYESAMWIHDIAWQFLLLFYDLLIYAVDNKEMIASALCTLYVLLILRRMRFKLWMVICVGILTIFIVSFLITWWKLVQEAEIKHSTLQMKHMKMPIYCQPEKMSLLDKFTALFSSTDDCLKYHEAMMKTPFLQVTPAQALSHMLSHVIYEPAVISGKALRSFLHHATADLPMFFSLATKILITITFLPLIVCCIILMAGGSLNVGGFGFLSFLNLKGPAETETRRGKSLDSKSERNPIEIMLNITTTADLPESRKIALRKPSKSNKLTLEDKSEKKKKTEKGALSLKLPPAEDSGSGDNNVVDSSSESEAESVEVPLKESREDGSGDHALK